MTDQSWSRRAVEVPVCDAKGRTEPAQLRLSQPWRTRKRRIRASLVGLFALGGAGFEGGERDV
jgi:hypothetical protein